MKKEKQTANAGREAVEAYLARVPEPARSTLERIRAAIRAAAPPEATERISYQIPSFHYKGGLMGYGAFPEHCSLFVMDPAVMDQFPEELKKYELSKGTIRFPAGKPLPVGLVRKLVKARVAQNEARKKGS